MSDRPGLVVAVLVSTLFAAAVGGLSGYRLGERSAELVVERTGLDHLEVEVEDPTPPKPDPTPQPATPADVLALDGTFTTSLDLPAGVWRVVDAPDGCEWSLAAGVYDTTATAGGGRGAQSVYLDGNSGAFRTQGCGTWLRAQDASTGALIEHPGVTFPVSRVR